MFGSSPAEAPVWTTYTYDALGMVCAGLAIGAPIAYWGESFAASLIQDLPVQSATPTAFGAVAMIAVAMIAVYGPGG